MKSKTKPKKKEEAQEVVEQEESSGFVDVTAAALTLSATIALTAVCTLAIFVKTFFF